MKFWFKKIQQKNCSKYTSTPLIRKRELLTSIVCIYVHSQQQEEKPVYLYTMASDGKLRSARPSGWDSGGSRPPTSAGVRVSRAGASSGPLRPSGAFSEHVLPGRRCVTYGLFPVLVLLLALLSRSLSRESQLASASAGSSFRICSTVFW